MSIAHIKVPGLDEARLVALIEPVLAANGVVGVELLWKTDNAGWVLIVNVERPDAKLPGEGITVDLCSDISRALSEVLDVDDLIVHAYHLEVGSPGIERHLYLLEDYRRFAGYSIKAKLREPVMELRSFRGKLVGLNESGQVAFEAEGKAFAVPFEAIQTCRLVYEWDSPNGSREAKAKSPKPRSSERSRGTRASQRKRRVVERGFDTDLGTIVKTVAQEKGIDPKVLIETMEAAILKAAQAAFGPNRDLEARYNDETGSIDLFQYMTVVDDVADPERQISLDDVRKHNLEAELGEELGFQVFWHPRDADKARQQDKEFGDMLDLKQARTTFGRIAAQTAKQVLLQRVRDAERDIVFSEYKDRQGQLIRGIVRRFEKGHNIVVDLGRGTEGNLSAREQTPRETYRPGDRIVAYVKDIDREARGPMIVLSRSSQHLVEKLFEAEVPEIYEGIVKIVSVAREPGARSKIAVMSRDADVDPVGACVGIKGSRVQSVVQELRGEKIDIVPWDADPARYIINAIQPAEVNKVIVDEGDRRMELVVPDEKLSLAIGRKGQNVRLASQLTGWRLDIISESKFRQMEDEALGALREIEGIEDEVAKAMYRLGFRALEEVADATVEELVAIDKIGSIERAEALKEAADRSMETKRQERIRELAVRLEPISERDKLRLLPHVGPRTLQAIEDGGYRSVDELSREDPDRLALKTGLGVKKAKSVRDGAKNLIEHELGEILTARASAKHRVAEPAAEKAAEAVPEAASEPTESSESTAETGE